MEIALIIEKERRMPTYAFRCPDCGTTFEERRGFAHSDDATICPECGGASATRQMGAPMFFQRGAAGRALLEAPRRATPARPATHASDCPCCSGRRMRA